MEFEALNFDDLRVIRGWRNSCLYALRTPFLLTEEMQEDFYKQVICNRNSKARYWGVYETLKVNKYATFVGMVGLENIEWENGLAEISIIVNPNCKNKGYGKQAVDMLLDKGFNQMRLENIYGECYTCNPAIEFWKKIIKEYTADTVNLPNRKYYDGKYWDSLYFNIHKEEYNERNIIRKENNK